MNYQYVNPVMVERTDKDMNNPEVNPDPFADKVAVDADLIDEASMGGAEVHEKPMGEMIAQETKENTLDHELRMGDTDIHETPFGSNAAASVSLLNREESENFRNRWNEIQGKFVDEPRSAVEQADELVTEVIELITQMFNNEHRSLEAQWNEGNDVTTEDLRIALQRYRSFFNNLVV